MKKTLLLKTMLLLCALVAGSLNGWADTTYKLTQVTSVENDGLYVFEQDGYVMNNTISSSALQTTNSYKTTGLTGNETYVWKLSSNSTGGFKMMNVYKGSSGYLKNESSTTVAFGGSTDKNNIWSFSFQTDNTVLIQNTGNSDRFLGYTSSTSHAYKAYAASNLSSYPHAIKVYKLEAETTSTLVSIALSGTYPTSFYTGDTFSHEGMTITATYEDESNKDVTADATFSGYDMSTASNQTVTVSYTENSVTKTTTYNITVSARPTFTVTFGDDNSSLTEASAGAGVTLPTRSAIGDYTFAGWTDADITVETATAPTILTGTYNPTSNITLYPVYTRSESSGDPVETKTQTLQYDTWTYSGSTTDKSSYRLFGEGSYIESEAFDLSKLSKVIVYGGTFGGDSYNSLTIGDGTNIWKNVTVSGKSETGTNTYTDGTALSGTGKLRVTSNSGNGSATNGNGVRISKVEIFTMEAQSVSYYTSHPSSKTTATWAFEPASLETIYVGEADATLTITTDYDGTLTASSSNDEIATITKTADKTYSIHAVSKGDATFTFSGDETDNFKAINKTITVSVLRKYAVTIVAPEGGTLVVMNGEDVVNSGDKFSPGTVLSITATADESHNFRNWQAVDASTHTYTASNTGNYTMVENDVTFKANFDEKVYHQVTWNVNGTETTENVEVGQAITFPTTATTFAGYDFIGWAESTIDGTVTDAPTIVTEANMGTEDVTYYAVFGKIEETNKTATFVASDITDTPSDGTRKWKHTATGITLYISNGQRYTNGTPNTFTVNKGTNNYFEISTPTGGKLTDMTVTLSGTDYMIESVSSGATLSTSGTTQTVTFTSGLSSVSCYATSGYQIRATEIEVNAILSSVVSYCTTISSAPVTITATGYTTFSCNNALDLSTISEGATAYVATEVAGGMVKLQKTTAKVPAGTGLFIKGTADETYTIDMTSDATEEPASNLLVGAPNGTTVEKATEGYNYVFGWTEVSNPGFYLINSNSATLPAGKAYLHTTSALDASAGSRLGIIFDDGEVTSIESVSGKLSDMSGDFFDLQGRKVANPTKGLYIVNGKKVVIK